MDCSPINLLTDHVMGLSFDGIPEATVKHAKAVIRHNLAISMLGAHTEEALIAAGVRLRYREPGYFYRNRTLPGPLLPSMLRSLTR